MKIKALITIFTTFLIFRVQAQVSDTAFYNSIGLEIGYSIDYLNDQNFSPINQKGTTLLYSANYERWTENSFKISISYGDGTLESRPDNSFNTSYYKARISSTYLKNISKKSSSTKFYIGGAYNLNLLYLDWYDQDAFSYITTNGLSVNGAISKQLNNKHSIRSELAIPFIQFLSRPPYNGIDEFIIENQDQPIAIILDGNLTSFNTYRAFIWNVNYSYRLSQHFNWQIGYTLNLQKVDDINKFKSLTNSISTSVNYIF